MASAHSPVCRGRCPRSAGCAGRQILGRKRRKAVVVWGMSYTLRMEYKTGLFINQKRPPYLFPPNISSCAGGGGPPSRPEFPLLRSLHTMAMRRKTPPKTLLTTSTQASRKGMAWRRKKPPSCRVLFSSCHILGRRLAVPDTRAMIRTRMNLLQKTHKIWDHLFVVLTCAVLLSPESI